MVGIGITTYNRSILEVCLKHFAAFTPSGCKIIVIDDKSSPDFLQKHHAYFDKYRNSRKDIEWDFIDIPYRQGIAKSKNECLKGLKDCSDVFLFDDDTFPQKNGWIDLFINCAKAHNIHHLQLLSSTYYLFKPIKKVGEGLNALYYFDNCSGACLYFTRHALDVLGGFDKRLGLYGGEHHQMSNRAYHAKLTGEYRGASPELADKYIYCVDMHYCTKPPKVQPPLSRLSNRIESSATKEEKISGWSIGNQFVENFSNLYHPLD